MYQCCRDTYAVGQRNVLKASTVVGKHTTLTLIHEHFMHNKQPFLNMALCKYWADVTEFLSKYQKQNNRLFVLDVSHWKVSQRLKLNWKYQNNFEIRNREHKHHVSFITLYLNASSSLSLVETCLLSTRLYLSVFNFTFIMNCLVEVTIDKLFYFRYSKMLMGRQIETLRKPVFLLVRTTSSKK